MPRFPAVSQGVEGLGDAVFSRLAQRAQSSTQTVYPLHVGDTWLDPYPTACAEAQTLELFQTDPSARFSRLHGYAAVQGEPMLVDAIQSHVERVAGVRLARESIQVVSGATAGVSGIVDALIEPSEEVLLPAPFWPLVRGTVKRRGGRAVEIPFFDRLGQAGFDPERALEEKVNARTVAIYVNSPHNPTGRILDPEVLAAIGRVARRHDLWIISDEVYEEIYFTPSAPLPIWADPEFAGRTIAVHSLSKAYGLAGARVGFVHGPPEAMAALRGVQTFTTYCAPRPMQRGAARVLREGGEWIARARTLYREAAMRTAEALGIEAPRGGTFAFFDLRPHLRDGEDLSGFLERCLHAGVLLTPGSASGTHYASFARVCFTSVPPDDLREALRRLRGVLGDR